LIRELWLSVLPPLRLQLCPALAPHFGQAIASSDPSLESCSGGDARLSVFISCSTLEIPRLSKCGPVDRLIDQTDSHRSCVGKACRGLETIRSSSAKLSPIAPLDLQPTASSWQSLAKPSSG